MMESLKEEKRIKDIWNLFKLKKETELIKHRLLRDTKNLFEHEENSYNPVEWVIFGVKIILNTKVTVMEIKHNQFKNILKKLGHI